jgi:IS5 family transposase
MTDFREVEHNFRTLDRRARERKVKELKKRPRIYKVLLKTEYLKAGIRAKDEHPFRIIKCQIGFTKARYRGLMKNDGKRDMLFALANIARVDQMLRRWDKSAYMLRYGHTGGKK